MGNYHRKILLIALKLSDMLIMVGSFAAATVMVFYEVNSISFYQFLDMRIKVVNFVLFVTLLILWHFIFSIFDLYGSRRLSTVSKETMDIIKATTLGTFVIYILSLFFLIEMITPIFLLSFWSISSVTTILVRLVMRYTLKFFRQRGRDLRHLLIVGINSRTIKFAEEIKTKPELGYVLLGFVDIDWVRGDKLKNSSFRQRADLSGFTEFIRNNVVDEVLIALPVKSFYEETASLINVCENQGILIRYLPNIFNSEFAKLQLEDLGDQPFVSHYTGQMENWQRLIKAFLDRVLSLILLLLLLPFFLVIGIIIKITSRGPIFFVQNRIGLNKRLFRLYKFRTMVEDAEQQQAKLEDLNEVMGAAFKIENDPRVTEIGRILRKTSIDEFPQLINVLKGDMSLVGPRPLPIRDYNNFNKDWQRRRFSVRPGITCLWQVNGRHAIPFDKWMELDLKYIDQWNLLLDLTILFKTISAVLKRTGAS